MILRWSFDFFLWLQLRLVNFRYMESLKLNAQSLSTLPQTKFGIRKLSNKLWNFVKSSKGEINFRAPQRLTVSNSDRQSWHLWINSNYSAWVYRRILVQKLLFKSLSGAGLFVAVSRCVRLTQVALQSGGAVTSERCRVAGRTDGTTEKGESG